MEITKDTKLKEIMEKYPWLIDEAVNYDKRFKILKSPVGKLFLKNATIGELSEKAGLSAEDIIVKIQEFIDLH